MANAVLTKDTTPTLDFADITSAVEYWTQVDDDQRFLSPDDEQTGLATSTFTVAAALTDSAKYYWRFRARTSSTLTADQTNATGAGSGTAIRDAAARTILAQTFKPGKTLPVSRVSLSLKRTGTVAGNLWVEIWTTSGGTPSAQKGSDSATVAVSTIGTAAFETMNFNFSTSISLVAGTTYAITLHGDFAIDGANYATWEDDGAGSYSSGSAYVQDGSSWAAGSTNDHIFTTNTHSWGSWSPVWSFWLDSTAEAAVTPTGWTLVDPDVTTDSYTFAVAARPVVTPQHVNRSLSRNLKGDMLGEYIAERDRIELPFDAAYIRWDQAAEILRFRSKRKPLYLIGLTDYYQDTQERIWKVDFAEDFPVESLADGRQDYYRIIVPFEEAALT